MMKIHGSLERKDGTITDFTRGTVPAALVIGESRYYSLEFLKSSCERSRCGEFYLFIFFIFGEFSLDRLYLAVLGGFRHEMYKGYNMNVAEYGAGPCES